MQNVPKNGNAWRLRNMLGNAAEWVQDDYAETAYSLASTGSVPNGQSNPPPHLTGLAGAPKVVRGGSWASRPADVRASARGQQNPAERSVFVGFRCVWNKPQP